MKAGIPTAKPIKLRCAIKTSKAWNLPYCKSVVKIGPESKIMPIVAGTAIIKEKRIAQSSALEKSFCDLAAFLRAKCGSITVAIATPNMPKGKDVTRSEKYSQERLPTFKNEANKVSIKRLICTTETPNIAGNINFKTFLTPSSRHKSCGRGIMLMRFKKGN